MLLVKALALVSPVRLVVTTVQVDERACQQVLRTKHLLTMSEERPEPPGPSQEPPRTPRWALLSAIVQLCNIKLTKASYGTSYISAGLPRILA